MYLIYWKGSVGQSVASLCEQQGIAYEMRDDSDNIEWFDMYRAIIPSPGIPSTHPIYTTDKVIAELDFAASLLPWWFRIFAITGTDGKSTTSWMLYSILQKLNFNKRNTYISGNFENPLSATVRDILEKWQETGDIVIEVSSFMAYWIGRSHMPAFSPHYTIITNLKSDHLNWHHDLQEYVDAKMNLASRTQKKVIMYNQIEGFAYEKKLKFTVPKNARIFSGHPDTQDWSDGENIYVSQNKSYKLSDTSFSWKHNAMNMLWVVIIMDELWVWTQEIRKYLPTIVWLPHRLEVIRTINGITCVEDSKSTSSQSLEAALGSFGDKKNLLLVVGGSDKGDTFNHLTPLFNARVKAIVAMWATKDIFIHIAQQNNITYLASDDMEKWVQWLYEQGINEDVLILSPGCASFWLFKNYLDRAHKFRDAVKNLP